MQPDEAFTELGQLVIGPQPLSQVLSRVAELAKACVPGAEEVSVTLLEGDSGARSAAFTGDLAVHLDERQYESGSGPCLDAAEAGQTVRIDDTAHESAYPDFAAIAVANHSLHASSVILSAHLQTAMQSRAVIEQAKGVVMAELHCTAEEAFQHMALRSRHTHRKLRDIAQDVVDQL